MMLGKMEVKTYLTAPDREKLVSNFQHTKGRQAFYKISYDDVFEKHCL